MRLRCGRNPIRQFMSKCVSLSCPSHSEENSRAYNERGGFRPGTCSAAADDSPLFRDGSSLKYEPPQCYRMITFTSSRNHTISDNGGANPFG